MSRTSYYAGGKPDEPSTWNGRSIRELSREIDRKLGVSHPELRGFIASAVSYLARDGQQLNDGRVLAEAKRRRDYQAKCLAKFNESKRRSDDHSDPQ